MPKARAEFGSLIESDSYEEIIPAFVDELRRLRGSLPRDLYVIFKFWENDDGKDPLYRKNGLDGYELSVKLMEALQEYAPAYGYFGVQKSNNNYGFWLSPHFAEDFDGCKLADTSQVPHGYTGEVLQINDHGNMTLYSSYKGKHTEIWAVV